MSIRRYVATEDTTITNAYKDNLKVRAKTANMGGSDSLETFAIYGRASEQETELSRILIKFPINEVTSDRNNNRIPSSGSVNFFLKLSNVEHPFTLPREYTLVVNPLSASWIEGNGLDMESYKDTGPANWVSASYTDSWQNEGGDYYSNIEVSHFFKEGDEDLEVDITEVVESWVSGTIPNYGLMIRFSSSLEESVDTYYTKKFYARGTNNFFKKPWIEARYDRSVKDDRGRFYNFNPFVEMEDNYNSLYMYNSFKGEYKNFPTVGTGSMTVGLFTAATSPLPSPQSLLTGSVISPENISYVTASHVSTGIYKCDIAIDTNYSSLYDIWFDKNGDAVAAGSLIEILDPSEATSITTDAYVITIKNLKQHYSNNENPRLLTYVRTKNWNPNSYTSLNTANKSIIIEDMFYKVYRIVDDYEVIPYGTGSMPYTRLSRDVNGNYFEMDMKLLEPGYMYGIRFSIFDRGEYYETDEYFKFRVEE